MGVRQRCATATMRRPARLPLRPLPESWRLGPEVGKLLAMSLQASRQQALHPQLADWLGRVGGPGA